MRANASLPTMIVCLFRLKTARLLLWASRITGRIEVREEK
jgi:hypothetical protein